MGRTRVFDDSAPAAAPDEVYELEYLRAGAEAIFGVKREVLDGAVRLRGLTGAVTKAEVAAAIDAFASHPV
jgi:hypothetical protein